MKVNSIASAVVRSTFAAAIGVKMNSVTLAGMMKERYNKVYKGRGRRQAAVCGGYEKT